MQNAKEFKCCNQDSASHAAGIIEGNLQVKSPKRLPMQMTLNQQGSGELKNNSSALEKYSGQRCYHQPGRTGDTPRPHVPDPGPRTPASKELTPTAEGKEHRSWLTINLSAKLSVWAISELNLVLFGSVPGSWLLGALQQGASEDPDLGTRW